MSDLGRYVPLYAGYAAALTAQALLIRCRPNLWPARLDDGIRRPWFELALLVPALALVVAIGAVLFNMGSNVPAGWQGAAIDTALEVVRFAPLVLFLFAVRVDWRSIWVSPHRFTVHFVAGLGLSALAAGVYLAVRGTDPGSFFSDAVDGLSRRRLHLPALAVHVLFEDLAIVVLAARVLVVCRSVLTAAAIVAGLFALAHVPALLAGGVAVAEITALVLDTLLGMSVFIALVRTRDILWFWPLHLTMDLTQFGTQ